MANPLNARVGGDLSTPNQVIMFFHCAKCIREWRVAPEAAGKSPREWARLEIGWTAKGIQVWCSRHDVNVMLIEGDGPQLALQHSTGNQA